LQRPQKLFDVISVGAMTVSYLRAESVKTLSQ